MTRSVAHAVDGSQQRYNACFRSGGTECGGRLVGVQVVSAALTVLVVMVVVVVVSVGVRRLCCRCCQQRAVAAVRPSSGGGLSSIAMGVAVRVAVPTATSRQRQCRSMPRATALPAAATFSSSHYYLMTVPASCKCPRQHHTMTVNGRPVDALVHGRGQRARRRFWRGRRGSRRGRHVATTMTVAVPMATC